MYNNSMAKDRTKHNWPLIRELYESRNLPFTLLRVAVEEQLGTAPHLSTIKKKAYKEGWVKAKHVDLNTFEIAREKQSKEELQEAREEAKKESLNLEREFRSKGMSREKILEQIIKMIDSRYSNVQKMGIDYRSFL